MLHAMLLAIVLAITSGLVVILIGKTVRSSIEGNPVVRRALAGIPQAARLEARFESRETQMRDKVIALEREVNTIRQHRYALQKAAQDARRAALAPVRVVGRENSGERFSAWMINRQVQSALAQGKPPALLDPDWATPQLIEVWSGNLIDARRELQRHYPPPLGYGIISLQLEAVPSGRPAGDGPGETGRGEMGPAESERQATA